MYIFTRIQSFFSVEGLSAAPDYRIAFLPDLLHFDCKLSIDASRHTKPEATWERLRGVRYLQLCVIIRHDFVDCTLLAQPKMTCWRGIPVGKVAVATPSTSAHECEKKRCKKDATNAAVCLFVCACVFFSVGGDGTSTYASNCYTGCGAEYATERAHTPFFALHLPPSRPTDIS